MIKMTRKNILIIGAGGVAHVTAHKCAQNNDVLGNVHIASRTKEKCDAIIDSIQQKNSMKDKTKKIIAHKLDAMDVSATVALIRQTNSQIVLNLGVAFINLSVLEACLEADVVDRKSVV